MAGESVVERQNSAETELSDGSSAATDAAESQQRSVILWSTVAPKSPPLQFTVELAAPDDDDPRAGRTVRDSLVEQVCKAVGLRFRVACTPKTHTLKLWDEECASFATLYELRALPQYGPIKAALQPLTSKPTPRSAPAAAPSADTPPAKRLRLDQQSTQPSPQTAAAPKTSQLAAAGSSLAVGNNAASALGAKIANAAQSPDDVSPSTLPFGPAAEVDVCWGGIAAVGLRESSFWLPPPQVRHDAVLMEFPLKTVDVLHEDAVNCIPSPRALGDLIGLL